jgi:hypothetical protein
LIFEIIYNTHLCLRLTSHSIVYLDTLYTSWLQLDKPTAIIPNLT